MLEFVVKINKKNGGESGIRTPGDLLSLNGFQDRRLKPLGQLSVIVF